ncbi:MAG: hypothetical protein BWY20_02477 [Spirochaetes bacterium ADurb.Bin215]|nr:MAG: hypothetical protein BWY20_02477 [Spirochaetes bacterium ADurb.Bin215]
MTVAITATGTAIAAVISRIDSDDRGIIRAVDGNRQSCRIGIAVCVTHRIRKCLDQGFPVIEPLNRHAGVV